MPGRGGRGGGRGGPLPRSVQVSKKIAWLLRHGAEKEQLTLGPGGFVAVDQVLANRHLKSLKVTFDELRQMVQDNDKQRFTMILASSRDVADGEGGDVEDDGQSSLPSDDPSDYLIRANQGHSLKVESEGLLTPITRENMPSVAIHGTTHAAWPLIVQSGGLKPMTRNHVHFASGLPAGLKSLVEDGSGDAHAAPVISGMRMSSTVLMFLDMSKAIDSGIQFGLSDNGVILSGGNEDGLIPLEMFQRVEDRTGEGILLQGGQIVKEAPAKWSMKKGNK